MPRAEPVYIRHRSHSRRHASQTKSFKRALYKRAPAVKLSRKSVDFMKSASSKAWQEKAEPADLDTYITV